MEQNTPKFRLRLNLFDGIVLVLALAVGAVLAWSLLKPAAAPAGETAAPAATVTYTIRFQRMLGGTGAMIQPGDKLVDTIKNYELGTVTAVEVVPVQSLQVDQVNKRYVLATVEGYEDALVTVEASCAESAEAVTVGGGYNLRVGGMAYIRGNGYMGSGPIVSLEREGQA